LKANNAIQRVIGAIGSPVGAGSVVGLAVGGLVSVHAAAIAGPIAGGVALASKVIKEHAEEKKKASGSQLFFYYKASKLEK